MQHRHQLKILTMAAQVEATCKEVVRNSTALRAEAVVSVKSSTLNSRFFSLVIILQRSAPQSLRPVTIKQIYAATQAHTDAEWMLEEVEVGQVRSSLFNCTMILTLCR